MLLLHRIGPRVNSNFNTQDEIAATTEPLGIDGIYESVLIHHDVLLGKDVTLFVMGNYVGKTNAFDIGEPPSRYLDWPELKFLFTRLNAKLGWHSWSHRDLTKLSNDEVRREVTPPFSMDYFAYPYGKVDQRVANIVAEAGYKEAFAAGSHGDGSQFQRQRRYLNW